MQLTVLKEQFFQNRDAVLSPPFVFATASLEQRMLFIACYVCIHISFCVFPFLK